MDKDKKMEKGRTKCDAPVRQYACFKHSQAPVVPDTYSYSLQTVLRKEFCCLVYVCNKPTYPPTTNFLPFQSPMSAILCLNVLLRNSVLICYNFYPPRTMASTLCSIEPWGCSEHISFAMEGSNIIWKMYKAYLFQFSPKSILHT